MYSGGIETRGNFFQRALGLDRVINRQNNLKMFRADGVPENHHIIKGLKSSILEAEADTLFRVVGLLCPFAAAALGIAAIIIK